MIAVMETKVCFKCQQAKPLEGFYKHSEMADGRLGKCKECAKADVRANRMKRREYYAEYDRARHQGDRAKASSRYAREWCLDNPEKARAQNKVNNAVRDGRLEKPDQCSNCRTKGRIEGHHADYSRPLDVEWLCVRCHKDAHRADPIVSHAPF